MGNKISAVNGVRSPNYYEPGNAINEIRIGNLELVSRLPFGDSELAQAGWPENDWPKIPWRQFIIPLSKRSPVSESNPFQSAMVCRTSFLHLLEWALSIPIEKNLFRHLSTGVASIVAVLFFTVACLACIVPCATNRAVRGVAESPETPTLQSEKSATRIRPDSCHRLRFCIAICSFLVAMATTLLDFHAVMVVARTLENKQFSPTPVSWAVILLLVWAGLIFQLLTRAASAVASLWLGWRESVKGCDNAV